MQGPPPTTGRWRLPAVRYVVGGLLLVAMVAGARAWRTPPPLPPSEPPSRLGIEPDRLNLGEVWETDSFILTLPIANHGATASDVTPSVASCSSGTVDPPTHRLNGGESAAFRLTLDLRNRCALVETRAVHDFRTPLDVTATTDAGPQRHRWEIRGRVRRAVAAATRAVDFGRHTPHTLPAERVVPVRAFVPLTDLSVESQSSVIRANVRAVGDGYELVLRPDRGLMAGRHAAAVLLQPTLADGFQPPPVRIDVEYELLPDVRPDTGVLALGAGRVGETLTGTITLSSQTGRPFRVTGWVMESGDGAEVTGPRDASGPVHAFTVKQPVKAVGHRDGRIRFTTVAPAGDTADVVVEVKHYGLAVE